MNFGTGEGQSKKWAKIRDFGSGERKRQKWAELRGFGLGHPPGHVAWPCAIDPRVNPCHSQAASPDSSQLLHAPPHIQPLCRAACASVSPHSSISLSMVDPETQTLGKPRFTHSHLSPAAASIPDFQKHQKKPDITPSHSARPGFCGDLQKWNGGKLRPKTTNFRNTQPGHGSGL